MDMLFQKESQHYHKSEKYEPFRKQNWFSAVHPNVQIDAKLDYMISRVLLEMDQTSLNIYKKNFVIQTAIWNKPLLFFSHKNFL